MYHQIVYASTAIHPRGDISDIEILREAISRNQRLRITGYLIRSGSCYVQALEGEEGKVNTVFAKIIKDARHFNLTVISAVNRPIRDFKGWSMGYDNLSSPPPASHSEALAMIFRQARDQNATF